MADPNSLLQGLAGLLQAAQQQQQVDSSMAALQQALGGMAGGGIVEQPQQQPPPQQQDPNAALAQLISGLAGALGGNGQQQQQRQARQGEAAAGLQLQMQPRGVEITGPLPSVEDFVAQNGLEPWVGEALNMLSDDQRTHVMRTQLNLENTTNLNGVITSRIKEVAPVEQRLQMFIQLNGLAEGVVDRLSTLTPDQHEKVMESTLKIQKANNPSGVAMRRITDVLRNERMGIAHGPHMSSPGYRERLSAGLHQPSQAASGFEIQQGLQQTAQTSATSLVNTLVESLGLGALTAGTAGIRDDRSRSRGPAALGAMSSNVPRDIQAFVAEYNLEWWVGEVLSRLSLWQRQNVMTELGHMQGVRNPSGVVMARVKQVANTMELLTIFIDINQLDQQVAEELWTLSEDQQLSVIAPGIYIQNARSPSVAARSRIRQVLAGNDAMGGARRTPLPETALTGV